MAIIWTPERIREREERNLRLELKMREQCFAYFMNRARHDVYARWGRTALHIVQRWVLKVEDWACAKRERQKDDWEAFYHLESVAYCSVRDRLDQLEATP